MYEVDTVFKTQLFLEKADVCIEAFQYSSNMIVVFRQAENIKKTHRHF